MTVTTISKIHEVSATDIAENGDFIKIRPSIHPGYVSFETRQKGSSDHTIIIKREDMPELISGLQKIFSEHERP